MTLIREKEFRALRMDSAAQLAANCPRCFGPSVPLGPSASCEEPDIIVCMDGNFQHRRHQAASVPIPGRALLKPELFIDPLSVEAMAKLTAQSSKPKRMEDFVAPNGLIVSFIMKFVPPIVADLHISIQDTCTQQHTAANEIWGKTHWGGCDDTGLVGMACRHDHLLVFANVEQSGEKYVISRLNLATKRLTCELILGSRSYYALSLMKWLLDLTQQGDKGPKRVGFLYDIGCNILKGIEKVKFILISAPHHFQTDLWNVKSNSADNSLKNLNKTKSRWVPVCSIHTFMTGDVNCLITHV